jgi:toxin ParE1/3/4
MSSYSIEIAEPAENDLSEIAWYIAKELLEPGTAKRTIDKIGAVIITLEEMPLRYAVAVDEKLAAQGIRKIIIDNYIVFYIVEEERKTVTIIRILYGRRDWLSLL